jgi:hypothetical protein
MSVPSITREVISNRRNLVVALIWLLLNPVLFAHTDVTSREEFNRLMPGGLPSQLRYNSDRASLELRGDDQHCPASAHGFFELNVNSRGEVTRARNVGTARAIHLKNMTVQWVRDLLMQIHFRPLSLGGKSTSVHTFATVVCQ